MTNAPRLPSRRATFLLTETVLRNVIFSFCLTGVGHACVSGARAAGTQPVGPGNGPAGFDPTELFGAVTY